MLLARRPYTSRHGRDTSPPWRRSAVPSTPSRSQDRSPRQFMLGWRIRSLPRPQPHRARSLIAEVGAGTPSSVSPRQTKELAFTGPAAVFGGPSRSRPATSTRLLATRRVPADRSRSARRSPIASPIRSVAHAIVRTIDRCRSVIVSAKSSSSAGVRKRISTRLIRGSLALTAGLTAIRPVSTAESSNWSRIVNTRRTLDGDNGRSISRTIHACTSAGLTSPTAIRPKNGRRS